MALDKDLTDDQIVWGMCEMKAATEEMFKGCKPWVVYYNEMWETGTLVSKADDKVVKEFVVEERAARIFAKDHLKVGDVIRIELEYADAFQDSVYVSGYKYADPASATG